MDTGGPTSALNMTRRAALGVVGAGILGAGLWPRTARSKSAIPPGRTVIDYWEKWTGPEGDAVQRVVDRFNTSQDRTWVRRIPVSDITSKAMVAIAGGDPPDVVGLYSYSVPQFAEAGAAIPLDDFGPSHNRIDAAIYAPAIAKLLSYDGHLWGGVSSTYSLALYYNRAMFKAAGLNPDQPPRTIIELNAASTRFVKTVPGSSELASVGFLPNLPAWWPYFWPIMFGGNLYDPLNKRAVLTDDATVKAYSWVQDFVKALGPQQAATVGTNYARSFHSPADPFISGAVPMIVQGPWIANFIRLYRPDLDYMAGPVPVDDSLYDPAKPTGMLEADVLLIPKGCRHPEEAFDFVRFTQQQEIQEMICTDHCKSSPLASVSSGFMANHPNRAIAVHDAIARSPAVQILPQTRHWQAYADMLLGAFDRVWAGAPVKPTLAEVETRVQEMIDRTEARRRQGT